MASHIIYPCIWVKENAHEVAEFYFKIFDNAHIESESAMAIKFWINNTTFMVLNGNAQYASSPALSFVVECDTQAEIDYYWDKLGEGGLYNKCGWLTDKYGISWQIIPSILPTLMADATKTQQVVAAFLKMDKFVIAELENI